MKKLFLFCLVVSIFTACAPTVNYLGRSYSPTTNLDVYFSRDEISAAYETMGQAEITMYNFSMQKCQQKLEEYAKQKGADAVFFDGIGITDPPSVTVREDHKKNENGGYTVVSTSTTNNDATKVIRATLIKYKMK